VRHGRRGGARDDLMPDPSVDIANGAPSGEDATDQIVLATTQQQALNDERVLFSTSTDGGDTWTDLADVTQEGDRGYYSAPAISPNGTDVWVVYNAFTTPFRESAEGAENDRQLVGVVLHAHVAPDGTVGPFTEEHRGASGDARSSSQNNLAAEFLGDYVYAAATREFGAAVWNDVRDGADCPEIDTYRQELHDVAVETGAPTAEPEEPRGAEEFEREHGLDVEQGEDPMAPSVQATCPATFGNSDISGSPSTIRPRSGTKKRQRSRGRPEMGAPSAFSSLGTSRRSRACPLCRRGTRPGPVRRSRRRCRQCRHRWPRRGPDPGRPARCPTPSRPGSRRGWGRPRRGRRSLPP
jgi:hypothetical protein